MEEEKRKDIEQKAVRLNLFENKLKEMEEQLMLIEKQINEFQVSQFALDELKEVKQGTDMLAPISPGIFVRAKILDNKEVLIDSGSKVFCKKNIDDAKDVLNEKINQIAELHEKFTQEINKIIETINEIQEELNKSLAE